MGLKIGKFYIFNDWNTLKKGKIKLYIFALERFSALATLTDKLYIKK